MTISTIQINNGKTDSANRANGCSANWDGERLHIDVGSLSRTWVNSPHGLKTCAIETVQSETSQSWVDELTEDIPEFSLPGSTGALTIDDVQIDNANDNGFTSEYLRVRIHYSSQTTAVVQEIWAWHNIGMRINFQIQPKNKNVAELSDTNNTLERLNLKHSYDATKIWGYYNDTQNRNTAETPILRRESIKQETWSADWANACALSQDQHALIMVKESHKCVNQSGINTGSFQCSNGIVIIDGCGVATSDLISMDESYSTWSTWYLSAQANEQSIAAAVRAFDRCRYPCNPETDAYIIANTWGSGHYGDSHPGKAGRPERRSAREGIVLEEIKSCGDLGIDVLQIDDGWQTPNDEHWDPQDNGWKPHVDCWPQGWKTAVETAKKSKVTLGLWAPAEEISYQELIQNYNSGGFRQYKLDFANFKTHAQLHSVMKRCRDFISDTDHKTRVNWDVTENQSRFGYYYGRDLGATFLANRKPDMPVSTIYEPWLMLRDAWQLAHYLSLKQFQISAQNPLHTDKSTEAYKHDVSYCAAISCAGLPLFFHRTSLYTDEQRTNVRNWLSGYQQHKVALHQADCQPIGDQPSNASWTGFHYSVNDSEGYLLVFRELHNPENTHSITVPGFENAHIVLQDCHADAENSIQQNCGNTVIINYTIAHPHHPKLYHNTRL